MHLSSVIIGPVVTEKAEKLKTAGTYVIRVQPAATKIDVKNALRTYYDVEVASIRTLRTVPKTRRNNQGIVMEKRRRQKRMIVRLRKSNILDLSNFQTSRHAGQPAETDEQGQASDDDRRLRGAYQEASRARSDGGQEAHLRAQ
jgi:large subunit ribosomal protein L23